jgi:hypothetical protein
MCKTDKSLSLPKVDNPYLITFLVGTPIFEWYISKDRDPRDMSSKEIGLSAQIMISILDSTINIIGGGGGRGRGVFHMTNK